LLKLKVFVCEPLELEAAEGDWVEEAAPVNVVEGVLNKEYVATNVELREPAAENVLVDDVVKFWDSVGKSSDGEAIELDDATTCEGVCVLSPPDSVAL